MEAPDHYQALDDAADLNAVHFLGADRPDPAAELDLYVALHNMGWEPCLAQAARTHRRRAAQYGAYDWVDAHARARAYYEARRDRVLAELRSLADGGPGAEGGGELSRARRAIMLAASHSGATDLGPLPAAWNGFHDCGFTEGARLLAACLAEWAHAQERRYTRPWTTGEGLAEMRQRRAPYVSYLWVTGGPADRARIERALGAELEIAMLRGDAEYRATRALVSAAFARDIPDDLAQVVRRCDRAYPV